MKQAVAELKDNLELSSAASGIDSLVQYFYDHTVSFLDYFTEKDSLIILDEPARVAEKGEAVTAEYRESMMGRLEKGYVLPRQRPFMNVGRFWHGWEVCGRFCSVRFPIIQRILQLRVNTV